MYAVKVRSVVDGGTKGKAELILVGTAISAAGHVGWLTLGRGVYCCEREEDVESEEEEGVHLWGTMLALGRKQRKVFASPFDIRLQNKIIARVEAYKILITYYSALGARLRGHTR